MMLFFFFQGPGQAAIQLVGTLQRGKNVQTLQAGKSNMLTGRQLQTAVIGGSQRKLPTSNTGQ